MADVGGVYINFGLWALALIPGWLVVRQIGVTLGDRKLDREGRTAALAKQSTLARKSLIDVKH